MAHGLGRLGFETRHVELAEGHLRVFVRGMRPAQDGADESPTRSSRPLLLLHGLGSSAGPLGALGASLDVEAVVPDLFDGAGESMRCTTPLGHAPLRPAGHADVLARMLDALAIGEVDVVGVSWGAWIALHLAAASGRARSLFLVAPAGVAEHLGRFAELATLAETAGFDAAVGSVVGRHLTGSLLGGITRRVVESRFRAARADDLARSLEVSDCVDHRLRDITCPTYVIAGDDDRLLGSEGARRIVAGVRGARGALVHGGPHELLTAAPVNVYLALRSWLRLRATPHHLVASMRLALARHLPESPIFGDAA